MFHFLKIKIKYYIFFVPKEYNMVMNKRRFRQDVEVYTLDGDLSDSAIVLLILYRKVCEISDYKNRFLEQY